MQAMNRQLLGQAPSPEVIESGARNQEFTQDAKTLMSSAMLNEAAGNAPENARKSGTLNFREQLGLVGSAPQEAGVQAGLYTRIESTGQSGTIFDGHKHQTEKRLNTAHQQVESFRQPRATSQPEQSVSTAQPSAYEVNKAERLQTLRQEALALGRRSKVQAAGRINTLHVQSEQVVDNNNGTLGILLRTMVKALKRDQQRTNAFRLQQERMAKKPKKGPGAFLEGGADNKSDMVAQMEVIQTFGEGMELTTGE